MSGGETNIMQFMIMLSVLMPQALHRDGDDGAEHISPAA